MLPVIGYLNLQGLGEAKLSSMNECKEFKRGIHMLDWFVYRFFNSLLDRFHFTGNTKS